MASSNDSRNPWIEGKKRDRKKEKKVSSASLAKEKKGKSPDVEHDTGREGFVGGKKGKEREVVWVWGGGKKT